MKVACIVGTRPEAIKMAPVIIALRQTSWARVSVISTGQHAQPLHDALKAFNIVPDIHFNLMSDNQSLASLTARTITALDSVVDKNAFDIVLAQGDTTTVMACSLVCFYKKIAFGHVEAGLRTNDIYNPFPEEFNRIVVSLTAKFHFAPTKSAFTNLVREGVDTNKIYITGNTSIDAINLISNEGGLEEIEDVPNNYKIILVTTHRRENFGANLQSICLSIKRLHDKFVDVLFIFSVHHNPSVKNFASTEFVKYPRVRLMYNLNYRTLLTVMKRSTLILTDSGGIQEEAPTFGKPVLILRSLTERVESVALGIAKIIGTDADDIFSETANILLNKKLQTRMSKKMYPYGDGLASHRIVDVLDKFRNSADGNR